MIDLATAAIVEFPLRGEWVAANTPAERVPSHGTDYFGQRYAIDFARMNEQSMFHGGTMWRHLLLTVPADMFFCWNEPVTAAFAGEVVGVGDGWFDRARCNLFWELLRGSFLARGPRGDDYRPLTGNYVLVAGEPGVALYAHLRRGSIPVVVGQSVAVGDLLGTVGNSGNSTMPHLHFHLMSGPDPLQAEGRLCAFRAYERFEDGAWRLVENAVPGAFERIRAIAPPTT